jgi:O-methyltransferase
VNLVSSTQTCLKYLFLLLETGGVISSQDDDSPLVIEALEDATFWENELKINSPKIEGFEKSKIIKIKKPL